MYYFGYKLHAVCGLNEVVHSFDITNASIHDIHYLKDVKIEYCNCNAIGDKGYISVDIQLNLFETPISDWDAPYRANQKELESVFSNLPRQEKGL